MNIGLLQAGTVFQALVAWRELLAQRVAISLWFGYHTLTATIFIFVVSLLSSDLQAAAPGVSNIRAVQRAGTTFVDITYDLSNIDNLPMTVAVLVSTNGGVTYDLPATNFTGDVGSFAPGTNKFVVWNMGADWTNQFATNVWFRIIASDTVAFIPASFFTMGDNFSEGFTYERPTHSLFISGMYVDRFEVTKAMWDDVYNWATNNGYAFEYGALGKAPSHPAHSMTWYDAVKWCNARSEREGRMPAYYTDVGLTQRYRTGQVVTYVNWNTGYRLPTEAEWEKAARGGLEGKRFSWGDTITHTQANYFSSSAYTYDVSATRNYQSNYAIGNFPYTSPVGSFAENGYGLCDMTGNVYEWCWDWYLNNYYNTSPATDPRGPATGTLRVRRGGGWSNYATYCRIASRDSSDPTMKNTVVGFRCVLPPVQP